MTGLQEESQETKTSATNHINAKSHHRSYPAWYYIRWTCALIVFYILLNVITSSFTSQTSLALFFGSKSWLENGADTELKEIRTNDRIDDHGDNVDKEDNRNDDDAHKGFDIDARAKITDTTFQITHTNTSIVHSKGIEETQSKYKKYWWRKYVSALARPFQPSNDTDWCQPLTVNNTEALTKYAPIHDMIKIKNGMYYVRIQKTASSTLLGMAVQIAENVGKRLKNRTRKEPLSTSSTRRKSSDSTHIFPEMCTHHVRHGFDYTKRVEPYFLWTMIRDPAKRALSSYYFFRVTHNDINSTHTRLEKALTGAKNFQFEYVIQNNLKRRDSRVLLLGRKKVEVWKSAREFSHDGIVKEIQNTIKQYHFIGITDRSEETLAVFNLLFDFIHEEDLIAMSAKASGPYTISSDRTSCKRVVKPNISSAIANFIATDFVEKNYDYFLYEVVNESLDRTIDMLGKERVQKQVERLRTLTKLVEDYCPNVTFPCSETGVRQPDYEQNCFLLDSGCGHTRVQKVLSIHRAGVNLTVPTVQYQQQQQHPP